MKTIWSHELKMTDEIQTFGMPKGALIVDVAMLEYTNFQQRLIPYIKFFFQANTDSEPEQRHFVVVKTGDELPANFMVHHGIAHLRERLYHVLEVFG